MTPAPLATAAPLPTTAAATVATTSTEVCHTETFGQINDNQWSPVTWSSSMAGEFHVTLKRTAGIWGAWGKNDKYIIQVLREGSWVDVPGHENIKDATAYKAEPELKQTFTFENAITGVRLKTPTWHKTDSQGTMSVCFAAAPATDTKVDARPTDYLMSGCRRTQYEFDPQTLEELNAFMSPLGMNLDRCFQHCRDKEDMRYFAVAKGTVCWCSKEPPGTEVGEGNCDVKCGGNPAQYCGGVVDASVNMMIDCLEETPQEKDAKQRSMESKLVKSYSKFEGQSCAEEAGDQASVASGTQDECKLMCWQQKDPCHGFTYDSTQSKCTFTADVLSGKVKKAANLACFFKKVGYNVGDN